MRRSYDVAFYMPSLGPLLLQSACAGGGAETQIWLLARGLARRGYAVCVIVIDTPPGLAGEVDGVDVILRPPWQGGRGVRGQLAELIVLWRVLAPLDAKVIVQRAAGLWTGLVALITRIRRRHFVYSSANLADFNFHALASTPKEARLFNFGLRLATTVIVQTDEQAEQCTEKFHRTSVVVRSIAEPVTPRRRTPQAFLWIGRLIDYKRPEAFLALARALPEAQFWLVGMPSPDHLRLAAEVERQARDVKNLQLLPERPRTELLELYEHGVAIVNTADFEGMPNIFLEGWSRGIPALALSHDPDGVIETNRLGGFAHGSQEELVRLARVLWSSRHDQAVLSARCRSYVEREHAASAVVTQWIAALGLPSQVENQPCRPVRKKVRHGSIDDRVHRAAGTTAATAAPVIGAARTTWHGGRRLADRLVTDRRLGISTAGRIPLDRLGLWDPERVSYEPSPWRTLRLVLAPDEVCGDDVFIDVGAGKGRIVIEAAAHYDFGRVIGLELSPDLASAARANVVAASYLRCHNVDITVGDATQVTLPDDVTVIFLYNPFRGSIFEQFLAGVVASLDRHPRALRMIYRTPFEHERLLATGRFRLMREHRPLRPTRSMRDSGAVRLYASVT
jgi:glycosyltransferase involved in cell wall biosynthesis